MKTYTYKHICKNCKYFQTAGRSGGECAAIYGRTRVQEHAKCGNGRFRKKKTAKARFALLLLRLASLLSRAGVARMGRKTALAGLRLLDIKK